MATALTSEKAKRILEDGTIRGRSLTSKQKKYFGAVAGGNSSNTNITVKSNGLWKRELKKGGKINNSNNLPTFTEQSGWLDKYM
jgi:hypothetical protein